MTSKCVFWTGVVTEVFLIVAVSVTSILMRQFLEPFHQGFFREDETLMHPYKDSSVTNVMLYTIGFIVPTVVIIIVEFVIMKKSPQRFLEKNNHHGNIEHKPTWILAAWNCYFILCSFYFGAAATHALTNLGKYSVGRLRPHFFDVCKPDWSRLNDTSGYIEADICTQTDSKKMTEARLSFPSGHSSIAMYCAVFFCIYLYKRFWWKRVALLCPLCQLIVFGTAVYTMMSRIHDFKHHWSDALVGGLLGVLIGVLAMLRILKVFKEQRFPFKRNSSHSHAENSNHNHASGGHSRDHHYVDNTFM